MHAEPGELRALSFFRERTSPGLGAFSKFTQKIWTECIPALSAAEDAVRKMSIAMASRQELLTCQPEKIFDLQVVCKRAETSAVHYLTQPDCNIVSILMCGLFFIGYECLVSPDAINPETSVRHLGAGLRILEEYHATSSCISGLTSSMRDIIRYSLEPTYLQMEIMLSIFNAPVHVIQDPATCHAEVRRPKMPPRFTNLIDVRKAFFSIYRWQYLYRAQGHKLWTPTSHAFQTVKAALLEWHSLVMGYQDALGSTAKDEIQRQYLLTMVSHWSLMMVAMVHSTVTQQNRGVGEVHTESAYLPHGGRMKTSVVSLADPRRITITFIIDEHSWEVLKICDWTEKGLSGDAALRIWPIADVESLGDGSGRGVVKLRFSG